MMSESQSALDSARLLAQAKVALDNALMAIVQALPEDQRSEFGEADEVSGFAFTGGFATSPYSFLAAPGTDPRAFFDRNVYCGAPDPGAWLNFLAQP